MQLNDQNKDLFKLILATLKSNSVTSIERKGLKIEALKIKISTNRGFDISLGILEGLELISIKKIGTAHLIEITNFGKETAKNLYGGNK